PRQPRHPSLGPRLWWAAMGGVSLSQSSLLRATTRAERVQNTEELYVSGYVPSDSDGKRPGERSGCALVSGLWRLFDSGADEKGAGWVEFPEGEDGIHLGHRLLQSVS